ncbi:PQQ-dependent sugar dehydrogenase [soil metagenome]
MRLKIILKLILSIFIFTNLACANAPFTDSGSGDDLPLPKVSPKFKIETVAEKLEVPWSIAFAPDGRIFFTERPGRVRVIENGKLNEKPIHVFSDVELDGETGLMGMALHPNFAENRLMYFSYVYNTNDGKKVRVGRFKEANGGLTEAKTIIENISAAQYHAGMRLSFSPADGKLYITTGDATKQKLAQDLSSLNGKTLRLNDDGSVPEDNPFVGQKGARPEIFSYGHRNAQGIAWQPETNLMFQTEHGPSIIDGVSWFKKRTGGDEVNIVERGKNYGWDKISHLMTKDGMETPLIEYSPAVAPASAAFYRGDAFPAFKGNLFFGALKDEAIVRLVIEERKITAQEFLLKKQFGRIREIAVSPEGFIYFSTSNKDGRGDAANTDDRILRIVPDNSN